MSRSRKLSCVLFAFLALMACEAVAATVTIQPGADIQPAIDANPPGTIFILPKGTWRRQEIRPKPGNQFIGDEGGGTVLDGENKTSALYANDDDVNLKIVFRNITVTRYGIDERECLLGAIHGAAGWRFENANFIFNNCTGLNLNPNSVVIGGRITDNAHAGITGGRNIIVRGVEIARNNTRKDDIYHDAGGLKISEATDVQLLNNWVHDNHAVGLWCDYRCDRVVIEGNTVVDNTYAGIMYEVSSGGIIRNNVVNDNKGIQIYVSSSGRTEVYNNNIRVPAGDRHGILVQSERRPDSVRAEGNVIRNNIITFAGESVSGGGTGFRAYGGPVGKGNYSDYNVFYAPTLDGARWYWMNPTPLPWDLYRARRGQDRNSKLLVGDGSIEGCRRTNCEGSGVKPVQVR